MKVSVLWLAVLAIGCSSPRALMSDRDGSYDYYALKDALRDYLQKPVTVHIGDLSVECELTGMDGDRLILRSGERVQEIPLRAISRLERNDFSMVRASAVSAVTAAGGWLTGQLVSSKVLSRQWEKFKQNENQIAGAAAGATLGFLAGAWYGSRHSQKSLELNPNVEPLVLDRAVGREITEMLRQKFGLFEDLPALPTESVVEVQIMQYGPTDYLVLYTSFEKPELPKYAYDGRETTIKIPAVEMKMSWMPVGREYLVKQQDKIHKDLEKKENQLKYRLFEQ